MKVFVSSTVYDLLDVRAEIAELLRSCGIAPVMSDDKLSDFSTPPDKNSIETCLVNVDSCDEMIVILDKRYGHSLRVCDYDDVSATQLEYRRFMEDQRKRPIHFFVRDRLDGDYSLWKKNKGTEISFLWVEEKDLPLFNFLEERRKLTADKERDNWIIPFTNSSDLKAALTKHYDEVFLPQRLSDAIYNNTFPMFAVTVKNDIVDSQQFNVKVMCTNLGTTTAFNTIVYFGKTPSKLTQEKRLIAPTQATHKTFPVQHSQLYAGRELEECITIEYDTTWLKFNMKPMRGRSWP
jgi:Domain of unknown function (DUF4062)